MRGRAEAGARQVAWLVFAVGVGGLAAPASAHQLGLLRLDVPAEGPARLQRLPGSVARAEREGDVVRLVGLRPGRRVVVRVVAPSGEVSMALLPAGATRWEVPSGPPSGASGYLWLGVTHILSGIDHLLLVLGFFLMLYVTPRALAGATGAFTLGHSVTLIAAALGVVAVPAAPVEVVIALSVLLLATELARPAGAPRSLLRRRPWLAAGGLGLLHGLGFASALAEIGLPVASRISALLLFNLGVELGQLAVLAGLFLLIRLLTGLMVWLSRDPLGPRWVRIPAYGMGTVAAAWVFERMAGMLGGL